MMRMKADDDGGHGDASDRNSSPGLGSRGLDRSGGEAPDGPSMHNQYFRSGRHGRGDDHHGRDVETTTGRRGKRFLLYGKIAILGEKTEHEGEPGIVRVVAAEQEC